MYSVEKIEIKIMKKKSTIDPWDQRTHRKIMLERRIWEKY